MWRKAYVCSKVDFAAILISRPMLSCHTRSARNVCLFVGMDAWMEILWRERERGRERERERGMAREREGQTGFNEINRQRERGKLTGGVYLKLLLSIFAGCVGSANALSWR